MSIQQTNYMTTHFASEYSWQPEFDEITCYSDSQVAPKLSSLKDDPMLQQIMSALFQNSSNHSSVTSWYDSLENIDTISDFQTWIEKQIVPSISETFDTLTVGGLDLLDKQKSYIFISNHRDIVMDPLLLNLLLQRNDFSTANLAIGDNLLISPIANDLAKLNKCFKVIRSLKSPKAILRAMKVQSRYIAYRHFVDNDNIWIAQKEGRSKDNTDITNPALLKMLSLGKPKGTDQAQYLNALNIVPVCYSYEWDPCDADKARQLAASETESDYKKSELDDLIAVQKGLAGNKGRIHVQFGKPIVAPEDPAAHTLIAKQIDNFIQQNYAYYPINYACYKKLNTKLPDDCPYSKSEIQQASKMLEQRLESESDTILQRVVQSYAAPLSDS